jgi:aryl-alcohol dehydrogenase-like predicted oxidoreductase
MVQLSRGYRGVERRGLMHDRLDQGQVDSSTVNRRAFLETGAAALTAASTLTNGSVSLAQDAPATKANLNLLPKRPLGKTGVDVSILNLGTWKGVGLDRLLRFAWSNGIRYVDAAKSYGSEPFIGRWLQAMPEVRKELFLVTKDHPRTPKELLAQLDQRLESLQTDYIDMIFIHAMGDHDINTEIDWPKSKEFKETAEAIRKSGKARFVGFSSHHPRRAEILQNAAEGGFVDAIMLQYTPWLDKDAPLNKALDACHKRGIGLISMKQVAGQTDLTEVPKRAPSLIEKGLTPYQALLHAIWTDERISSACVSMRNTDQIRENSQAARTYQPMSKAEIEQLRDACLASRPTLCADCDGRCSHAAGTKAELGNLTRFLTYHDHHGYRGEARRLYSAMSSEARDWSGADLEAAHQACPSKLDFATLLPKADRTLA